MYRRARAIVLVTVLLISASTAGYSQTNLVERRKSLAGFDEIHLTVEEPSPAAARDGLDRERLEKLLEIRLLPHGLKLANSPLMPTLKLDIHTLFDSQTNRYFYTAVLGLYQPVQLSVSPEVKVLACTWSLVRTGSVSRFVLRSIENAVREMADEFVSDYIAANQ